MKLTLNRREETKGLMFKKPVYILDVAFEFTDDELQLIKKHKWQEILTLGADSKASEIQVNGRMLHPSNGKGSYRFEFVENLSSFQELLVERAKLLKNNLGAVVGFTSGGSQEVEL